MCRTVTTPSEGWDVIKRDPEDGGKGDPELTHTLHATTEITARDSDRNIHLHHPERTDLLQIVKRQKKNHKAASLKSFDHFCGKKKRSSFDVLLRSQLDYHLRLNKIWWKAEKELLLAGLFITAWGWIRWSIQGISPTPLRLTLTLYVPLSLHRCIWEPAAAHCIQRTSASETDWGH